MDEKKIKAAVEIITKRILTPVLYLYEEEVLEFICFSDSCAPQEDFDEAERLIYEALGIQCEIVDIREFSTRDRLEIIETAELVYSADHLVQMLFESAMSAEAQQSEAIKEILIQRKKDTGTYYIS